MIATGSQFAGRTDDLAKRRARKVGRRGRALVAWIMVCCGAGGCSATSDRSDWIVSHAPATTVAVAPALNFSGSADFDPVQVADLMASELSDVPGIGILGANRVMAILAEQGLARVQSPEHAMQIRDRLGAETILVFAITEYDAYTPVVGMAAQIYGRSPQPRRLDPVVASRAARPFPVADRDDANRPRAQVQRVFNGAHDEVQRDVRAYAESRDADESPYGWRKYLRSQQLYLRYCCHRVVRELMEQQATGESMVTATGTEEYGS